VDTQFHGYRKLARAVLANSLKVMRQSRPTHPDARRAWDARQAAELAFWHEPHRSAPWCEAAGLEWEFCVERLTDSGMLPSYRAAA